MNAKPNTAIPAMEPLAYTVAEACQVSKLGRTTLYQLISEGRLKICKIGTRTLVPVDSLRALIGGNA